MNYYRLDLASFMSSIFVWCIFLSDFGLVIAGQPIYFFQILAFGYLISYLIYQPYVEKGWLLFFVSAIVSICASGTLFFEPRQFAGDTYPWTSIKAFINILLFYAVYKTALFAYYKINPNLFLYLSIFMIFYGSVEVLFGSNPAVKEILQLLHTNQKALDKNSISLLGREHSYGALGYMCAACVLGHAYLTRSVRGLRALGCLLLMFLLAIFVILAKSKSIYIGMLCLLFLLVILVIRRRGLSVTGMSILALSGLLFVVIGAITIQNNYAVDMAESMSGDVGSGSTFVRFNFLQVAVMQGLSNPFFGVGPGNYKLYFIEYIYKSGAPIILELEALTDPSLDRGSVDAANFFAGIFAEFGIIVFLGVFSTICYRVVSLIRQSAGSLQLVPLSVFLSPVMFGAALGFYYWSVSFFPFYLAILHADFMRSQRKI